MIAIIISVILFVATIALAILGVIILRKKEN